MTGRAAGYCAGYSVPGFIGPVPGRGMRWKVPFYGAAPVNNPYAYSGQPYTTPSREEEISYLNEHRNILEEELESLKKRINELESEKK